MWVKRIDRLCSLAVSKWKDEPWIEIFLSPCTIMMDAIYIDYPQSFKQYFNNVPYLIFVANLTLMALL